MQKHADNLTNTRLKEYNASTEDSVLEKEFLSDSIIHFNTLTMEKFLKEIPTAKVRKDEVAI